MTWLHRLQMKIYINIAGRGRRTPGHAAFYLKLADSKELGKFEFVKEKVIPHPHLYIKM